MTADNDIFDRIASPEHCAEVTFEGCRYAIIYPEDYQAVYDTLVSQADEIVRLRGEVARLQGISLADELVGIATKTFGGTIAPAEAKGDAMLHIARLRGISNHIKACPAYENLRADADCIESAIEFIQAATPQPAGGEAVVPLREVLAFIDCIAVDGKGLRHTYVESRVGSMVRVPEFSIVNTTPPATQVQQEAVAQTLRNALEYVGYRTDGDLATLAERADLWMRESRVLIDSQRANNDRLKALAHPAAGGKVRELVDVATGKLSHLYRGECPDVVNRDARDNDCPACAAIRAALAQPQEAGRGN